MRIAHPCMHDFSRKKKLLEAERWQVRDFWWASPCQPRMHKGYTMHGGMVPPSPGIVDTIPVGRGLGQVDVHTPRHERVLDSLRGEGLPVQVMGPEGIQLRSRQDVVLGVGTWGLVGCPAPGVVTSRSKDPNPLTMAGYRPLPDQKLLLAYREKGSKRAGARGSGTPGQGLRVGHEQPKAPKKSLTSPPSPVHNFF